MTIRDSFLIGNFQLLLGSQTVLLAVKIITYVKIAYIQNLLSQAGEPNCWTKFPSCQTPGVMWVTPLAFGDFYNFFYI